MTLMSRYTHWLHTRWPAGTVEKLPDVGDDGRTSIPGVRIVGDLTGIPLLKFSVHTGARAVKAIMAESDFRPSRDPSDPIVDLAIIGAGVSGMSAALEARKHGLATIVYEAVEPFTTIANFPKAKPIFTYPTEMVPEGDLTVTADVKEALLEELDEQRAKAGIEPVHARVQILSANGQHLELKLADGHLRKARRVIVAIGRTGNYRKLGVPGEKLDKVYNRLYDPMEFAERDVLVVGGGDSALEAAIALVCTGANVTLSYRKPEFSRPKPANLEKIRALQSDPASDVGVESPASERVTTAAFSSMRGSGAPGSLRLEMASEVESISEDAVELRTSDGTSERIPNDVVFAMIGREAPLDFFRRAGIRLRGELTPADWLKLGGFFALMLVLYLWKSWWIGATDLFRVVPSFGDPVLREVIGRASADPSAWFTLAYSVVIVVFGIARIRRRRTPYVTLQTVTLMAIQVVPLFLLPVLVLPYLHGIGALPAWITDTFFPGESWWRAYGLILAWPLFLWNLATPEPVWGWLVLGLAQTFVLIPILVHRWGKGAYCGWICSCGAMAETLGDTHRHKMWHGPLANRWNMTGQVILVVATLVTVLFVLTWSPSLHGPLAGLTKGAGTFYKAVVDVFLAGAFGLGVYFWFSGRVWCRFACPLAALMHVYARFSRFRIFSDKKKCISCNVCTSVCHQGIDVMNVANKGLPMEDPQCVRCSACVQSCPTGVLSFGRIGSDGRPVLDRLAASPVRMAERSPADDAS